MYLSFPDQDSMEEDFLEQTKGQAIDLIVCSDAEAILGIGDQGVGVNISSFAASLISAHPKLFDRASGQVSFRPDIAPYVTVLTFTKDCYC